MSSSAHAAVERTRDALARGETSLSELTARGVGELLGKTTGALYHHFGSLDGFLHQVAQSGFVLLAGELAAALAHKGDLADVAERFVDFGLAHQDLYELMFERRYDWDALRRAGVLGPEIPGMTLYDATLSELRARGVRHAERDARLLYAGLHGLVSLALSGRANVGRIDVPDAAVAKSLARDLARRLFTTACKRRNR